LNSTTTATNNKGKADSELWTWASSIRSRLGPRNLNPISNSLPTPQKMTFLPLLKKFITYFLNFILPLKIIFYIRKSLENIFKTFYTWKKRSLWGKRIFPLFCMERINRFVIIIIIVIILTKFIVYLL
jgi:hypothetical protein